MNIALTHLASKFRIYTSSFLTSVGQSLRGLGTRRADIRLKNILVRPRQRSHRLFVYLANVMVFVATALIGGFGSAWLMTQDGSTLTTQIDGPWHYWPAAGTVDADPYTRAHVMRAGYLPLTGSRARYYFAREDSAGKTLYAECEYEITGSGPEVGWWTLSAYTRDGELIDNTTGRYSATSSSLMRDSVGRYTVSLASEARPGNWLASSSEGAMVLVLRLYLTGAVEDTGNAVAAMPEIKRIGC